MSGSTTGHGGWNTEQMAILGLPYSPPQGWVSRLIGLELSEDKAQLFLSLKGKKRESLNKHKHSKKKVKDHPDLFAPVYSESAEEYANNLYSRCKDEF